MSFFRNFPTVNYFFGNEISPAVFQNLTTYIDLIDQVSDQSSFYEEYYIPDGYRPDVVSYDLYGTTDFYWTFALLNSKLRLQGWPLDEVEVYEAAKKYYPNLVLFTRFKMWNEFFIDDILIAVGSGNKNEPDFKARILEKDHNLGQLIVKPIQEVINVTVNNAGSGYTTNPTVTISGGGGTGAKAAANISGGSITSIEITNPGDNFTSVPTVTIGTPNQPGVQATATATISSYQTIANNSEVYSYHDGDNHPDNTTWPALASGNVSALTIWGSAKQHLAPHHFEDANKDHWDPPILDPDVDGDPIETNIINNQFLNAFNVTEITNQERLIAENEELRKIKVFTPQAAIQINTEYQRLLRS